MSGRWGFALRLTLLGTLAGGCFVGAAWLGITARPVSALVAAASGLLALTAIHRLAGQADRALAQMLAQVPFQADDRAPPLDPAFPALAQAMQTALERLGEGRLRARQTGDELSALLDCVSAALLVVDAEGKVGFANRAARRLAGGVPHALGQAGLLGADEAAPLLALPPGQTRLVHLADGRAALASLGAFRPAGGAERRLLSLQLVAEDLSAVELNAWQAMARVLSHELMNSLAPVISLAESLAALPPGHDGAEVAEVAGVIARRAEHILRFVERYREVIDLPEPLCAAHELAPFAADMVRLAQALPGAGAIRAEVDPPRLTGWFDRELAEQALLNLLKNAVEAGADAVLIRCRAEGDWLHIDVIDNGAGLGDAHEEVFLPFYTTKAAGTGTGLTIARRIALAHGGVLLALPSDRGAWFSLRVPRSASGTAPL